MFAKIRIICFQRPGPGMPLRSTGVAFLAAPNDFFYGAYICNSLRVRLPRPATCLCVFAKDARCCGISRRKLPIPSLLAVPALASAPAPRSVHFRCLVERPDRPRARASTFLPRTLAFAFSGSDVKQKSNAERTEKLRSIARRVTSRIDCFTADKKCKK